jgi:glycosyltransferase involved in cell wall biosynthesis
MRIAVVIPTWRRPHRLEACLEGLDRQMRRPDDVLVVAQESDEQTWELLKMRERQEPLLRPLVGAKPGVVAALNRGLGAADADVVAITDDDAVPRPDWLARIESHFKADPLLGGVGGKDWLHPRRAEDGRRTVGKLRWYGRLLGNHHLGVGPPREVDVLKGVNMSFRLAALPKAGIDRRLEGVGLEMHSEIDLCFAVRRGGAKLVYDPAVAVDHYPAAQFGDDFRQGPQPTPALERVVHNETYLLLKWLSPWRRVAASTYWLAVGSRVAPGLLVLVERSLRGTDRGAFQRFRVALRGRLRGWRTFLQARGSSPDAS